MCSESEGVVFVSTDTPGIVIREELFIVMTCS